MIQPEQVIRLTGAEDIHAVRALIAAAQAARVMLVVPPQHPAFQRLVRLKMLARQAHAEGIAVALVTEDGTLRSLASQLDFSTFRTVEAARRAPRWRAARVPLPPTATARGAAAPRPRRQSAGSGWGENIMLAGLLFGVMIIMGAVLVLLLPSASITLVPQRAPLDLAFPVIVDPGAQELNIFEGIIPADILSQAVQGTEELATTGRSAVPATAATGEVLFLNITGQPITLPEGTIVSTTSGAPVRFRTTAAATLAGEINARATVPVEAVNPGPVGNVGPLQINLVEGAAASAVRVLNEQGMAGGDVQQRAVVAAADKEQLFEQLRARLLQEGRAALERSLAEGANADEAQSIVPGTVAIELTAETYNASVDDQRDVLSLDLRARVSAIVVSQADVERVARRRLREGVPEGYRMLEQGVSVVSGEAQRDEAGLLRMAVRAQATALADLQAESISALVRGQPLDEAQALLLQNLPLSADPAIQLSPDWWSRLPLLPLRIFIRVGVLEP